MSGDDQRRWIQEAIDLSIQNVERGKGGPFAALIVKGDRIIARGTNLVTSTNDPTAHAEIIAIREACRHVNSFHLTGCEIYSSCEPCPMCLAAIHWARIDRIFFGNSREDAAAIGFDDLQIYEELALPLKSRTIPITQVLREKAILAFRAWEAKVDKV
jgi:guanine deaminase